MSFAALALRASKHSSQLRGVRAFHSPFAVLGRSPLTTPTNKDIVNQYEKHYDQPSEPLSTSGGYRTYVVSEPDASYKHYQVPAGAYPTSEPYVNFSATAAPDVTGAQYSSTGSNLLAHEFTTRRVPQNAGGVGESSAVRFRSAPGEMGARGGGEGGLGMMDKEGTQPGLGSLGERNPAPDEPAVAEKYSKAGVDEAWKLRK